MVRGLPVTLVIVRGLLCDSFVVHHPTDDPMAGVITSEVEADNSIVSRPSSLICIVHGAMSGSDTSADLVLLQQKLRDMMRSDGAVASSPVVFAFNTEFTLLRSGN